MQFFYYRMLGPVIFMGIAAGLMWLIHRIMNLAYNHKTNVIWAMALPGLAIVLTNNYNLPFSVIVSMVLLLLLLLLYIIKGKSTMGRLLLYTTFASLVYYISGSGYLMLFSIITLFFSIHRRDWGSLILTIYMVGFALFLPHWISGSILPMPLDQKYLFFFPSRIYFMPYEPSVTFYIFLVSALILPGIALILSGIQKLRIYLDRPGPQKIYAAVVYALLVSLVLFGHFDTYRSDAKKTVASDYYCYVNNADKAARAAKGLKDYNFAANLNYNLAISKSGRLADDFFKFFQISGCDALHPDVEFASEMSFIACDFYYDLGYISEARHWAYESLVFYPYSPRALQMLVKIHLVTREYKAAGRCLNILSKTLIDRKFTAEYQGYIEDTTRINKHLEIIEKRSFIPPGKELSPFIDQRFRELLETNPENKRAYEYLLMYYLLDAQLENFMELFSDAGNYFHRPSDIFEEAVLMYGAKNQIPVQSHYDIRPETMARYDQFNQVVEQHKGNKKMARNYLYWEMGDSYLYYLQFVFPRIVKPEIVIEENEEPPI